MRKSALVTLIPAMALVLGCQTQSQQPDQQTQPAEPAQSAQPDNAAALIAHAEAFVDQMVAGEWEKAVADFDATMTGVMPPDKLKESWGQAIDLAGPFVQRLTSKAVRDKGYDIAVVTCEFERAPLDIQVVYDAEGKITGLWTKVSSASVEPHEPAAYVDDAAFTENEVTVGAGEWALPGTLAVPTGDGPFPAVVLVHGSGPQDRDETIGPSKPFRDLAGGLASRGVAVLRYEKRTKAHAAKLAEGQEGLTVHEETVEDAILAADLLRATAGIDPDRVYVLGHSLGGMLIPRIAAGASEAAGFVIMAGTTRGLAEVTIEQLDYILSLKNEAEFSELERTQIETMKAEAQRVRELDASAEEQPDGLLFGAPASYWLDLRAYDPAGMVKDVKRPLLVLQGGRDYQVTEVDFDNWRAALAGRDDVTFRLYPDLNHIFATGEGMATPEEYGEPAHVAEEVINDIADWIANHG